MPAGPPPPVPPEYLQQSAGQPFRPPSGGASGRRKALIAGGAVVGLGAATAAVFGAMWYFGTGPQPAEALPDSTIAYVSVDIDPSGKQLLEGKKTAERFPAWNDLDISSRDDLREAVFELILAEAPCDLDYNHDVEPWIGNRLAAAAVDLGEDEPVPVGVVQVEDADQAEDAFERFAECGREADEAMGGWAIRGEWAVLAETEDIATQVAEDAKENPLSDDDDFEKWTGEAGDPGILTAYAAPEAGTWLVENAAPFMGLGGMSYECVAEPLDPEGDPGFDDPESDFPDLDEGCVQEEEMPDEVTEILKDFSGAALTVRFDDGAVEVETATSVEDFGLDALTGSDNAGEAIETLPDDTAAAIAYGFEEGWFEDLLDYLESSSGMDIDADEIISEAEELGLDLPEDAETLAGESAVIAVGPDFDPQDFVHFDASVSEVPVGLKIKGDPDEIQEVIDKILDSEASSEADKEFLVSDSDGDFIAFGPNGDYRKAILEDGDLGGSDTYENVVRESDDAASILYVNFDAGGGWFEEIFEGDQQVQENVAPLEGAGMSAWADDGVGHLVLRITTE